MKKLSVTFLLCLSFAFNVLAQDKKINLGNNINSPTLTDSNPLISPNGRFLFFRRDMPDTKYDIYISYLELDGSWGTAKPVAELNNKEINGVLYIYPDGNTIILKDTYSGKDGFVLSYRTSEGWSTPKSIELEEKPSSWDNQNCSLSSDGTKAIISNQRDLYLSIIDKNGRWGKFQKLNGVNTSDNEFTPFLASDNKTLYFSSGGWGGLGSNDIVKSTRLDENWLNWSAPTPIGAPVNTSGWESYFSISAKSDLAFVYMLEEGGGDIFSIKLKDDQKANPVALVSGHTLDKKTNKPIAATVTYENLTDNLTVGKASTNPTTGQFSIVLQYGKKYAIVAQTNGYIATTENIDLTVGTEYKEFEKNIYLYPLDKGTVVPLNNIFFETGKFVLQKESYLELDRLISILKENSNVKIALSGHTDNVGDDQKNLLLSQNRSDAVYKYLIEKGISKNRLTSKGYGKTKPITNNKTDEEKQKNRRVEFVIV